MGQKATSKLHPRLRILFGDHIALGPGKADLLSVIAETGSIRRAAQRLDMSYMRAWKLVQTMNACFGEPLVIVARGGTLHGGARLSLTGQKALALYRKMEESFLKQNENNWRQFRQMMRS